MEEIEVAQPVITSVTSASDGGGLFQASVKQESLENCSSSSRERETSCSGVKVENTSDESDVEVEDQGPLLMTENNDDCDNTGDLSSDSENNDD